jgi:hypothetical protein
MSRNNNYMILLVSPCVSAGLCVCPHTTTRKSLNEFSENFVVESFTELCRSVAFLV